MNAVHRSTLLATFAAAVAFAPAVARADEKAECVSASEKAQSLRDDRKFIKAREQFLTCARDVCPAAVKKDCADQVADLDKRMPSVVVRAKDKTGQDLVAVKVTSDGMPLTEQLDGRAIPLDPGVHTFRLEAAGNDPIEQKIVLAEGEHDRAITAQFGKPGGGTLEVPQKKGAPIGALIVMGVGLAGMGVGGAFWGLGLAQKSSDEGASGCKNTGGCSQSEIDSIHSKLVIGDVAFFAGTAVLVGGVIWTIVHYASGSKEGSAAPAAMLDVAPATYGRGAVASASIRW
jgi:hypothetical protein